MSTVTREYNVRPFGENDADGFPEFWLCEELVDNGNIIYQEKVAQFNKPTDVPMFTEWFDSVKNS